MGRVVTLITASRPETLFATFWPILAGMAAVLLVLRPLALTAQNIMANQAIAANVVQPDPLAEPLARGAPDAGRSSRTISPAASPTG